MNHSLVIPALAAVAFSASARTQPILLDNVGYTENTADQSITVTYDLSNEGEPAYVRLDILTNGVSIGMDKLKTLSGDVSQSLTNFVTDGTGKHITWRAKKDWPGNVSTEAVARVYAYYTNQVSQLPGVYMVVDLSGGPNAASYPVSYTLAPPDPSNDVTCCSNKLWLKRVETNTFVMGSPTSEEGHVDDDLHKVTLTHPYFIGVFPVTRAQYALVMGSVSVPTHQSGFSSLCPINCVSYDMIRGATTNSINWPTTGTNVLASSFLGMLRSKTGSLVFDLPTEAQWECACRAGTTTAWNDGSNLETNSVGENASLDKLGWYMVNANNQAHPVGRQTPNLWGLYDCHGNVNELCLDWIVYSLGTDDVTDPVGPNNPISTTQVYRIQRGGGWNNRATDCRSASRQPVSPSEWEWYQTTGFRLACHMNL